MYRNVLVGIVTLLVIAHNCTLSRARRKSNQVKISLRRWPRPVGWSASHDRWPKVSWQFWALPEGHFPRPEEKRPVTNKLEPISGASWYAARTLKRISRILSSLVGNFFARV